MIGKLVVFYRSTLNHFYGLQDIEFDDYLAYVSDHVDLNEIVNAICKSRGLNGRFQIGRPHR